MTRLRPDAADARSASIRTRLIEGQAKLAESEAALVVVIIGSESLRAEAFWSLAAWLDARHVDVHAFEREDVKRSRRPELTVWFNALPANGRIGLYYTGWYGIAVEDYLEKRLKRNELDRRLRALEALEDILLRDGYRVLKLWLTLPEDRHKSRRAEHEKARLFGGKSLHTDRLIARHPKRWARLTKFAAKRPAGSPWAVVEIEDDVERQFAVAEKVAIALESPSSAPRLTVEPAPVSDHLSTVDLSLQVSRKKYKKQLRRLTRDISTLFERANRDRVGIVLAFEGWDAAGKGGVIKRLLSACDPRLIRAIRIAAPTSEESSHHYLWRFTRQLPEAGEISVFDRSWYGRVLVERVEGFAPPERWSEAYDEIVRFERELAYSRYVILKFWLHISPDEQLRRFRERENVEYKLHKLTEEDWRNREKRSAYEDAANEMFERTDHKHGPWHLVSAENKYSARLEVMRTVTETLATALGRR